MEEINLFYYTFLSELEKAKSKRCYSERVVFDKDGKKVRRKLEKGYVAGVSSAISVLKKVKKEFDKNNEIKKMESEKGAFIQ